MGAALVSIIIPTYNRAHLLGAAIRSAQSQTYPATQIIIIDDGSTDDTRAVVAAFDGVEYYYQPNQGQAAARNAGLRHCRGEFMASLDSDDVWDPDFLASSISQLQKHRLDFVFLNWNATNGSNGFVRFFALPGKKRRFCTRAEGEWWLLDAAQTRRLFVETCPAPSSSLVIRSSALQGQWNEEMHIADDWCLILDMVLSRGCRSAFTMQPHWLKHVHDHNIYDGRDELIVIQELGFHDEKQLAQRYQSRLSLLERGIFRRRMAQHYFSFAYISWKRAAPLRTVAQHLAAAFWLAPIDVGRSTVSGAMSYLKKRLAAPNQ
ncbi:glycosyltransferase family A protein [Hymenobacter saemangeumensis]|uniref:Glycosyltransferase family A protein n=1 Tax=Hymenobacter saemangeumensis TaxID=1084522 RepID=A0ABP8INF1_9BACT